MNLEQAEELAHSRLSKKRFAHTRNVRDMAVSLARRYGADEDRAALAALLHDAAKEIPKKEMRALMGRWPQYAGDALQRPEPVWHGVCAAILARTQWGVEDEQVLDAIACHTAGRPGMTQLDKTWTRRCWRLWSRAPGSSAARRSPWTLCPRRPTRTSWPGRREPPRRPAVNTDCSLAPGVLYYRSVLSAALRALCFPGRQRREAPSPQQPDPLKKAGTPKESWRKQKA